MAHPVKHTYVASEQQIMTLLPRAIKDTKMQVIGCHKRLGIISFRQRPDPVLYAHIMKITDGKTRLSIAPGLPRLKNRKQSEVPHSEIKQIKQNLKNLITNNNK